MGIPEKDAFSEGVKLLGDKAVRRRLNSCKTKEGVSAEAIEGLRRLAFGRVNDALKLLNDNIPAHTERLNLFNVSEIKRLKGGGVEIKFFDRLEALEKLSEIESRVSETESADSFFSALKKTVDES